MATYAQQQAENLLKYYQGMSGTMRKPSALASAEEREAFAAQEARAGRAPMEALPEEYGGRPTGGTRRALRQQWEWDQARKQQLAEEQAAREVEEFNKNMLVRDLDYQTKSLDLELKRTGLAADLQNQKIIKEQAVTAREIFGKYPDTPEGLAAASAEINKVAPRAWEDETIGKIYFYKDKNSKAVAGAIEAQSANAEQQAQLRADIVTYGITPEQQKEMLESNLPAGVVRFDPLKAMPVIAAAKKAQEAAKETKAEEKETKKAMASKEENYQKALAEYKTLEESGLTAQNSDVAAKAMAEARAAAAVLGLPKIASEEDFKKYKKGDMVLAPNGIDIIMVP